VTLFASFKRSADFYGKELVTDLYMLSKKSLSPFFDVTIRYTELEK
jgi:hypothetical protein